MCDLILSVSDESLRTKAFNGVSEIFDLTQTSIMNNPNVSVVINNSIINNSILNNTIVNNSIINNSVINGNPINIEGGSNLLLIQGKKFKTTKSFVKIINLLFDTIKFLTYFDNSLHEDILHLLAKSINIYIVIGKNIIIEGDGTIKGKSITEKEIALLCSNFNMLSFIMEHFLTLDKNETISLVVKGLINSLEKSKENCIDAISQLISEM